MKVYILSGIVQSSNKKLFEANDFSNDNKKAYIHVQYSLKAVFMY